MTTTTRPDTLRCGGSPDDLLHTLDGALRDNPHRDLDTGGQRAWDHLREVHVRNFHDDVPPIRWGNGDRYTPTMKYRLWTRAHTSFAEASRYGRAARNPESAMSGRVGRTPDGRLVVCLWEGPDAPEAQVEVDTMEEGDRYLYDLGIIGYMEVIETHRQPSGWVPPYTPDEHDAEYARDWPEDDPARTEGAARTMAYGNPL